MTDRKTAGIIILATYGIVLTALITPLSHSEPRTEFLTDCSCTYPQATECEATDSLSIGNYIKNIVCSCPLSYQEKCDFPEWQKVALRVAQSHDYEINSYNCVWFANNFAAEERAAGYEADAVVVAVNCSSGLFRQDTCKDYNGKHKIGKLTTYWETETGYEILPEDYDDYGIVV